MADSARRGDGLFSGGAVAVDPLPELEHEETPGEEKDDARKGEPWGGEVDAVVFFPLRYVGIIVGAGAEIKSWHKSEAVGHDVEGEQDDGSGDDNGEDDAEFFHDEEGKRNGPRGLGDRVIF